MMGGRYRGVILLLRIGSHVFMLLFFLTNISSITVFPTSSRFGVVVMLVVSVIADDTEFTRGTKQTGSDGRERCTWFDVIVDRGTGAGGARFTV